MSHFFLQQINVHPTRKNNILDLVFTRSPETVRNLECVPPTQLNLVSDHSLLFFDFGVHAKLSALTNALFIIIVSPTGMQKP